MRKYSIMTAIILTVTVCLFVVGFLPGRIYVDNGNNLCIRSMLLFNIKKIPVSEISIMEMPEGILRNNIRTFGASVGKYNSGKFYNRKLKTGLYIFTKGSPQLVYFEYEGKKYVVDSWL